MSVCGWLSINIAIVASSVLAFPLVEGGMESDRWEQWLKKMPLSNYMCSVLTGSIQMMMTLQLVRCQGKIRFCAGILNEISGSCCHCMSDLWGGRSLLQQTLQKSSRPVLASGYQPLWGFFKIRDDEMRFIEM